MFCTGRFTTAENGGGSSRKNACFRALSPVRHAPKTRAKAAFQRINTICQKIGVVLCKMCGCGNSQENTAFESNPGANVVCLVDVALVGG